MKENEFKIIYACMEHIEMALDDFINYNEDAPNMEKCEGKKCCYCENDAVYKISE